MKRVLVTGASGFIGRHVLGPLRSLGYEVHAVTSRDGAPASAQAHWHRADLLEAGSIAGLVDAVRPTHLLHLAWHTQPASYRRSPENYRWLESGIALIRHFHRAGGTRIVMAGSCAEYESGPAPCVEDSTPLRPATPYGFCKHALHQVLDSYCGLQAMSGAWGRVFFMYGPGEHPGRLVASTVASLLRGEPARCSDGEQVRDFLHVEDAAGAFVALLDSAVEGAVNIASGEPVTVREVVLAAAERLGARDRVRFGEVARAGDDAPFVVADCARLRREVGFVPRYDLRSGLAHAIEYWKAHPVG